MPEQKAEAIAEWRARARRRLQRSRYRSDSAYFEAIVRRAVASAEARPPKPA